MVIKICQSCGEERKHYANGLCRKCYRREIDYPKNKKEYLQRIRDYRERHREENKEYNRRYREQHRNEAIEYGKRYRVENQESIAKRMQQKRASLRREMLEVYGGRCVCCGETEPVFLTLDHKNGGGTKHQILLHTSMGVLRELKKQGWPKDRYQILCWNCNYAKYRLGKCPHQK